ADHPGDRLVRSGHRADDGVAPGGRRRGGPLPALHRHARRRLLADRSGQRHSQGPADRRHRLHSVRRAIGDRRPQVSLSPGQGARIWRATEGLQRPSEPARGGHERAGGRPQQRPEPVPMRMLPSRYSQGGAPLQFKKKISKIKHVQAPLKGLSLTSKLISGDPLQAPILDNWVVEEDRIRVRPGTIKIAHLTPEAPISAIVPFYGFPNAYLLASNTKLHLPNGTVFESGFTDDDWAWTAFSNLGTFDFTIMCNGHDGVWSWDGGTNPGPALVTVTKVAKTNPVQVTVGAADIGKFHEGQSVIMSGITTTGLTQANGTKAITFAGMPINTFALVGINGTAAAADQTTGTMRADPQGSLAQEAITAPLTAQWINPLLFSKVC